MAMSGFRRWMRRRRWWQRIILSLLISFVVFVIGRWIAWEYTYAQGEKELADAIVETEKVDPRWRWEQIEADREQVPDEENSNLVVMKIDALRNKWNPGFQRMPNGEKRIPEVVDNHRLDDDDLAELTKELKEHDAIVQLALSLKNFPRGRGQLQLKQPNPLSTSLAHAQACRPSAAILSADAERVLHEGSADKPCDHVRAILNAGAGLRGEPSLISLLVRVAVRVIAVRRVERILAMSRPRTEELKSIESRLAGEETEELYLPALRGERAMFHILFENIAAERLTLDELGDGPRKSRSLDEEFGWKIYKSKLPADHAHFLRTMNELIAIACLPTHEQLRQLDEWENRFRRDAVEAKLDKERLITTMCLPAVNKVAEAAVRDKALLRCAITALAAERYRIDTNEWPKSLADLCPKYMNETLLDPFDGQPLKYTSRDDGVTIYSVGADGIDGGAKNLTASGREPGADLGFRLWNVDQRGLPPVKRPQVENEP
jgi:hypothetical protein